MQAVSAHFDVLWLFVQNNLLHYKSPYSLEWTAVNAWVQHKAMFVA